MSKNSAYAVNYGTSGGFHFEVTPQKSCCLWPNSPDCKKYDSKNCNGYCCGSGFKGRPVTFRYTPDSDRWKCCSKFKNQ